MKAIIQTNVNKRSRRAATAIALTSATLLRGLLAEVALGRGFLVPEAQAVVGRPL